ncbi:MAG: MATE family efflux transporter [Tissierellia bacterium]|nr:MATE family efflux transporter [Tissierellia bacterium]
MIKENNNMITEGRLLLSIVKYFIPILLGGLFQHSYSLVDALIIGNYAGASALAAIDAPYAYIKLLINTFIALSAGSSIVIAQNYGANRKDDVKGAVNGIMIFSVIGGLIISIIGVLLTPQFVEIMLVPKDIVDMCNTYMRIYFSGSIFVFLYNMSSSSLRAIGDSKRPFYYLVFSSMMNIILDLVFVAGLKMGVGGAALATVISQGFSVVLILLRMRSQYGFFIIEKINYSSSLRNLKLSLKLGLPMAFQSILFSVSNMYMQRGINSFGTSSIAGWSICGKSDFLVWSLSETFGVAVCTFVAQNYGAKKIKRTYAAVFHSLWLSLISIGLISVVLYLVIGKISSLFTNDLSAIKYAVYLMQIVAPFYIIYAIGEIFAGAIKGYGQTLAPMIVTLLGTCLFRIGWILYITPLKPDIKTVILGYPLSWIVTTLLMIGVYVVYKKLLKGEKDIIEIET